LLFANIYKYAIYSCANKPDQMTSARPSFRMKMKMKISDCRRHHDFNCDQDSLALAAKIRYYSMQQLQDICNLSSPPRLDEETEETFRTRQLLNTFLAAIA
jgi:hypothetical protein